MIDIDQLDQLAAAAQKAIDQNDAYQRDRGGDPRPETGVIDIDQLDQLAAAAQKAIDQNDAYQRDRGGDLLAPDMDEAFEPVDVLEFKKALAEAWPEISTQLDEQRAYYRRVQTWITALKAITTNESTNVVNWMLEGPEMHRVVLEMAKDLTSPATLKAARLTGGNPLLVRHRYEVDTPSGMILDTQTGKLEEYDPARHQGAMRKLFDPDAPPPSDASPDVPRLS